MSDDADAGLDFGCELEAPPEKVWRALTIPAFRERWLGASAPAEPEVIAAEPPHRLSWSWREAGEPDGTVTFTLTPTESGGTALRLVHRRAAQPVQVAANGNITMLLAA